MNEQRMVELSGIDNLTAEQCDEILNHFTWIKILADKAKKTIVDNLKETSSYKVVESNRANSWVDETQVLTYLKNLGYEKNDLYKVKGITDMKKSIAPNHYDGIVDVGLVNFKKVSSVRGKTTK